MNISENEFLHYTNERIENTIITNLTVLGGLPCGANDNEVYKTYSLIENNAFCISKDKTQKNYYFFKNLSTISLKEFYEENEIDVSELPEYSNLTSLGNMTLFLQDIFL